MLPTNTQIIDLLQENPQIQASAEVGVALWSILSPAIATFCHYLFHQIDPSQANSFFKSLRTGANLKEGDPILALRNRMIAQKGKKGVLPQYEIVALVIKTWNLSRRGKKVKHLGWQYNKGERFPVAI